MGLDRYRLLAQLGAGSDGISYRAEGGVVRPAPSVGVGSLAAECDGVRSPRGEPRGAEPGRWERLVPRLRLAAGLAHPAAVRVLDVGLEADPPYVALEWVGTTTMAAGLAGLRLGHRKDLDSCRRDRASPHLGRCAGGGPSAGAGPRPARPRAGLARRWAAQARFHGRRRRVPGRVGGVAGARRGLPRPAGRRRPGGRSRRRSLQPGCPLRLAADGPDRSDGPRVMHRRAGFRPAPGQPDSRAARRRPGRSSDGE